jgi:glycosyltransferase involved in cell wall biosynthesis
VSGVRIAHVTDCFLPRLGGIERQVHHLAKRQQQAGHDVSVVTAVSGMGARGGANRAALDVVLDPDASPDLPVPYRVHRPPARWRSEWTSTRAARQGREVLRSGGFDAVHAHISVWSPMAAASVEAAVRAGLPTAVTVHSVWGRHALRLARTTNRAARWDRWPVAWSAVSTVAAAPLRSMLPAGAEVSMMPNGINPDWWRSAPASPDARQDGPRETVRIVAVMRFAARKRGEALIDMLEQVRRRTPARIAIEAVLVGDGPRLQRVADAVRQRGMSWVRLPGRATAEEVRAQYRDADVFVAPSVLESFGIAALEARSAGVPVVAFGQSGVRDIVRHEREGLLADSDEQMVDALVRLVADSALRERIAAHNRASRPPFDWAASLERCDALYARATELAADDDSAPRGGWVARLMTEPIAALR